MSAIDLTVILNLGRINPNAAIDNAVLIHKEEILQLNDAQLDKGLDSNDVDLGEYKNFKYKQRFRPIDLLLTGEFRATEDIIPDNDKMLFVDLDEKTPRLMDRYGEAIIGIDEQDQGTAALIMQPTVIDEISTQLSL